MNCTCTLCVQFGFLGKCKLSRCLKKHAFLQNKKEFKSSTTNAKIKSYSQTDSLKAFERNSMIKFHKTHLKLNIYMNHKSIQRNIFKTKKNTIKQQRSIGHLFLIWLLKARDQILTVQPWSWVIYILNLFLSQLFNNNKGMSVCMYICVCEYMHIHI